MIKVRLAQGVYEVVDTKSNMKMFINKEFDSFFVKCSPEESNFSFPMALVDKKDVIKVEEDAMSEKEFGLLKRWLYE